jgi:acylphosphatase
VSDVAESRTAVRCLVAGRVQGVYYRASTAREALALGLDGSARNLDDGRVEVIAAGAASSVACLCSWLWQGPPGARVSAVTVEEWEEVVPSGFEVR